MADTARTRAALLTLLANNTTGAISEQDVRDVLVSVFGGFGMIGVTGGSTDQTSVSATPAQITGFTANSADSEQCTPDHSGDDITLNVDGVWLAAFACSFTGTLNTVYTAQIRCTGTGTVFGGACQRKIGANNDEGNMSTIALVTGAVATDTIDVTIAADASSKTFTPTEMGLLVYRIA